MSDETNANVNLLYKVQVQLWLLPSLPFNFFRSTLMDDISHYIVPLNHPLPTLVHHLSHHLSSCPISLLLQLFWIIISQETLFRGLLHKNAAIMVGTMHLMWRLQPFYRYFRVLPPNVSVRCFYVVGTSWSTIIMVRVNNLIRIQ